MLEAKTTVIETKDVSDELISSLDTAEGRS